MNNEVRFLLLFLMLHVSHVYAQQGKDGAKTITGLNTVVNEYTALTVDAQSGNNFVTVNNSSLNSNLRFSQSLTSGDLIMIIQMQGATINGSPTDSTWGAITNYNSCGLYEFAVVASAPNSTTININCSLKNNYSAAGKTQIIRVPRFSSLTVNAGDTLTCDTWNGATGGIVTAEVENNTIINSGAVINVTGKGFRGGVLQNMQAIYNVQSYINVTADSAAEKGESIAGFGTDYTIYGGMYGRGAPANGGGGGDSWNASGGGGANAGNINAWTGNGNPDTSNSSWIAAWNLEYTGFAGSTSSGGGRGGYSFAWSAQDPLTDPPGNSNWAGDSRRNHGGKGGRPLDYSTGRIFLGGGGGAGHEDNFYGSGGANGGGMVYLLNYGSITGNGYILANGDNAGNSIGDYGANGEGSGGAGGGGTIILNATGTISGITAITNGGEGGNQVIPGGVESEGPGGGGGGGYIAISNGTITQQALGGANGTTNSPAVAAFPPNGATSGGNGSTDQSITNVPFSSAIATVSSAVSVCPGGSAVLSASGGGTYAWSPTIGLSCDTCASPTANPVATTVYYVTISNGSCSGTDSIVVTISNTANAGVISSPDNPVCEGASVPLLLTGASGMLQWQYSDSATNFIDIAGADSAIYFIQPSRTTYFRVLADSSTCADTSLPYKLTVNPLPASPSLSANDSTICSPDSILITASGIYTRYLWSNGDTTNYIYAHSTGKYSVSVTDVNGCTAASNQQRITIFPALAPPGISTNDSLICASDSTPIHVIGTYSSYAWNDGDTRSYTYANEAGNYRVSVTDTNGCSAVSRNLGINVYPVPSVSTIVQGNILASFNSVSYQWFFNDSLIPGATGYIYTVERTGNYAVQVTDTNGCKTLSNYTYVVLDGITGIVENDLFQIYPNPFTNTISIKGNSSTGPIQRLSIYNVLGERLEMRRLNNIYSDQESIDVSNFAPGVYFLIIAANERNYFKELIKE